MKVILYEDVPKVGSAGEIKEVSDGFARNFLFPRKLALPPTPSNIKKWQSEQKLRQIKLTRDIESARSSADQLEKISLTLSAHAGKEGHLFGSITSQMIAEALLEKGISIEKKNIVIESPIKSLGEYQVQVRLHAQVNASLKVQVISSAPLPVESDAPVDAAK